MYVLVNYKTNTRLKDTYWKFVDAFKNYEFLANKDLKIEYWDFENNTCKLVWTNSYDENILCEGEIHA